MFRDSPTTKAWRALSDWLEPTPSNSKTGRVRLNICLPGNVVAISLDFDIKTDHGAWILTAHEKYRKDLVVKSNVGATLDRAVLNLLALRIGVGSDWR